jgi:AcrR family transcriptional regulator
MPMNARTEQKIVRRRPRQLRARQTVEAVLDAVARIVKREGAGAVTTNRIAEVAGVSIGSLYQYFADKRSIFEALHQRHIDETDRLVYATLREHAQSPLDRLIRAVVDAMVETHAASSEFHATLFSEIPHRAEGTQDFATRLHAAFCLALRTRTPESRRRAGLDKAVFIVANMIDSLAHAAALSRPPGLSLDAAKKETVRAVLAYLRA